MRIDRAAVIMRSVSLDDVAAAVGDFVAEGGTTVYVERQNSHYRWSPARRGGAYPLLRVLARGLECKHSELVMRFVNVDGFAVVADPAEPGGRRSVVLDASSLVGRDLPATIDHALDAAA